MAALRGTVQGGRGKASRLAQKSLTTNAATWTGAIEVRLDADGNFEVELIPIYSGGRRAILAAGNIDALLAGAEGKDR